MRYSRLIMPAVALAVVLTSCSTTSGLADGEVLYRGIDRMQINGEDKSDHGQETMEELLVALECPPNGSLMGSSSLVTPFPVGLWVYNALAGHQKGLGKWAFNTFGTQPVLISTVNPQLRAKMAANTLHNFGYFRSRVTSEVVSSKNPKKAKVNYTVDMGKPFLLDSIAYLGFKGDVARLVDSTRSQSVLARGDAFSVIRLDEERQRIASLLQNNGYYYFKPEYVTYKADTLQREENVQLRVEPVSSATMPADALRRWHVGNLYVNIRQNSYQRLRNTLSIRSMRMTYGGKRPPVRPGALVHNIYFRPGELYSLEKAQLTEENLSQLGIFSRMAMTYSPRDTLSTCDTLDVNLDLVLDKPLSAELQADFRTKSNGQIGPSLSLDLTRKNVFHGGETFSIGVNGSYEWQTQKTAGESSYKVNSYELGLTASLTYPRIMFPGLTRLRSHHARSTAFSLSADNLHRAGFFHILSFTGEVDYTWQAGASRKFSFTPLRLTYSRLQSTTEKFDEIMNTNKSLFLSMKDQLIPAMGITYTYDDKAKGLPVHTWYQLQAEEAGNIISAGYAAFGNGFSNEDKKMLGNPFDQFVKLTAELRKTFHLTEKSDLATRLMGGFIYAYGNSHVAPYSEQFYVGGANSIRAYTVRAIGPGSFHDANASFLDQTGDIKLEANMEYRFNMVGGFNGALFVDAGNVWLARKDEARPGGEFRLKGLLDEIALGTGVGLRYDMDFLVLRLDLGVAIHNPYDTGKKGYYNIPRFKDSMSLHFAIGYPF